MPRFHRRARSTTPKGRTTEVWAEPSPKYQIPDIDSQPLAVGNRCAVGEGLVVCQEGEILRPDKPGLRTTGRHDPEGNRTKGRLDRLLTDSWQPTATGPQLSTGFSQPELRYWRLELARYSVPGLRHLVLWGTEAHGGGGKTIFLLLMGD